MKKSIYASFFIVFLIGFFGITAFGTDTADDLFNETKDNLISFVDSDTADMLDDLGLICSDFESIGDFSFGSIIEYFSEDLKTKLNNVISHTLLIVAFIFIMSLITLPSYSSDTDIIEFISVCIIIPVCFSEISSVVKAIISATSLTSDFLLGYIPAFAALVAMSGNVSTALSYNSLLLAVSETCSRFLSFASERITGIYFAFAIGFSLNRNINLSRFTSSFSKCTSVIIGFISSLFAAFLTVKSVFSVNIDTVSAKGMRLVLSSFIPVVGSAISDAYSTLVGSIGIVKSSVAVIGIAVALVINLPVMFEGMCLCVSYNILSFSAEMLSSPRVAALIKAVSIGLRFLLLVEVFIVFILIISTAVMVSIRSGA